MNYFEDFYQSLFNEDSETGFLDEIANHEGSLKRIDIPSRDLEFCGIFDVSAEANATMKRILPSGDIETFTVKVEDTDAWNDTYNVGTKLAVKHGNNYYPVSDNIKLSVFNRSGFAYKGLIRENTQSLGVNPMSVANSFEALVKAHNKQTLQLVLDGGKIQAVLTNRYVPTDQRKIFKLGKQYLAEGGSCDFAGGYVSHTYSEAYYKVASEGKEITATVRLRDSSTGDGCVAATPRITIVDNGKTVTIAGDDEWTQRHSKFAETDLRVGVLASISKVKEWAAKLAESMLVCIANPMSFYDKVFGELNKLARKMSTSPIGKADKEKFKAELESTMQFQTITLWDFIQLLWSIPSRAQGQANKESMERTVSRILLLDIDKLNV